MQFHSFAKSAIYTIRASFKSIEMGVVTYTKPLRAVFVNHSFNSETSAAALGWTEEERQQVENALLNHRELGKPRGFYALDAYGRPTAKPASEPSVAAAPGQIQCLFVIPTAEGDERCEKPAVEGGIYCAAHAEGAKLQEAV